MEPKQLEQVLNDTRIVFVQQMFQQGKYESKFNPVDYVVSSYGQPSRPVLWVSTQQRRFSNVKDNLLRAVLDYQKEDMYFKYKNDDNCQYVLELYMMQNYHPERCV